MVGEDDLSVASYATPSSASTAGAGSPSLKRKKKFRKAPQAPRRFRSPYILFSISKMQEYKKSMAKHGVQVTSFSSRIAQDWKKLPDHEREKWEEAALQDKLRYNAEKELYTGPWQVPTGRSRKNPDAPKRPASAFLFYSQTMRTQLKQENPDLKNTEISKLLGQAWKNSSQEVRRPHIERELREREVYKRKVAKWREEQKEQESLKTVKRQALTEEYMKSSEGKNNKKHAFGVTQRTCTTPPSPSTSANPISSAGPAIASRITKGALPQDSFGIAPTASHHTQVTMPSADALNTHSDFSLNGDLASFSYEHVDMIGGMDRLSSNVSDNQSLPPFFHGDGAVAKFDYPLALLE